MTGRVIARPRLVELLNQRWERRVVLVTAGPGFGKSSALAEAVAENALAPRGVDVLVECSPDDRTDGTLVRRIASTAGIAVPAIPPTQPVEWLLDELAARWPLGACLLLDDAHVADEQMVQQIITQVPAALHLVLSTRTPCRGLARLRARGEVLDIGEDDLRLSPTEVAELARLNAVDPAVLRGVDGWPAAAAMAATYGIGGAEEYLFETVVSRLDRGQQRLLSVALAVGGGDAELLRVACGAGCVEPAEALAGLPLVRHSASGGFIVHDLWRRVLHDVVSSLELDNAASRAVGVLVGRGQFERAFSLCAARGDWNGAADVIRSCCRRGHADLTADVAEAWLAAMPAGRCDEPDGLLLRGLAGRVRDPFGAATADVLDRAVAAFRERGDVVGEVAAGVALCYVLRNQGRINEIAGFIARALELDELGHHEAAGPAAVGRAILAELDGDDATKIARLEEVPDGSLSDDWQDVRMFHLAMGHLVLGNRDPMLRAAARCAELAAASPSRHVASLATWLAGEPELALARLDDVIADRDRSGVHAVQLGSIAAMVAASTGRVKLAASLLSAIDTAASGPLSVLLDGAVVGVRALVAVASGDDDSARATLQTALDETPLSNRHGWRRAVRWLPLAYVLVPATRSFLDGATIGEVHQRRLDAARAVVWALERSTPSSAAPTVTAATLYTSVPLPWAMLVAGRLAAEGSPSGAQIAAEMMDHFGESAKDALRTAATHRIKRISSGAKSLLATVAAPPEGRTISISVLGPTMLDTGTEPVSAHWSRDRVRSLLLYLALRRSVSRDEICEALWSHLDPGAGERNLRVTLCYLQQVLEPERRNGEAPFFVRQSGSLVSLAPAPFVRVDTECFQALVHRAGEAEERGQHSAALELLEAALAMWRGPCLGEVALEEWSQVDRWQLEATFVRAATRAGHLHLAAGRADRAVACADQSLRVDQWSESAYQLKIAAALQLGDRGRAARELAACDQMLADLGVNPDERTEALRRRLQSARSAVDVDATSQRAIWAGFVPTLETIPTRSTNG